MKLKIYSALITLLFTLGITSISTPANAAYVCRWVNSYWSNGYYHHGHKVCWNRYPYRPNCVWRHGVRYCGRL